MKKTLLYGLALLSFSHYAQQQNVAPIAKEKSISSEMNQRNITPNLQKSGTALWGSCATTGIADGQFSNPFVQSTTAGSYNPTSWTALSVFDENGTPGAAYWNRNTNGYSNGAYSGVTTPVSSASAANGVASFESDFLDNGGTQGAFGLGTSPSPHKGELISPRIDLTGYTNTPLEVKFFSFYRDFLISELSVSFSTDNGTSWSSPVDYRSLQANQTEGYVTTLFANVTAGLANLTQCRIKFTFDGDYYFAIVDDVCISIADEYDLSIGTSNYSASTVYRTGNQIHLSNNRYSLASEAGTHNFQNFGANVKNEGFQDIVPSDNVKLAMTVQKDISGTWTAVHNDTIDIPSLIGDTVLFAYKALANYSWLTQGDFRTIYNVFGVTDNNTSNDTIMHLFTISDDYTSKVDVDINGMPFATQSVAAGGGPFNAFEWGSIFNFPNAGSTALSIDSISFTYFVRNTFTGAASQSYLAKVYEFTDLGNSNTVLDNDLDLTLVGIDTIELTNLNGILGQYNSATLTNLVDTANGNPVQLSNGKQYYISICMEADLINNGTPFSSTTEAIQIGASALKSYGMNALNTPIPQPTPLYSTISGVKTWYWTGFGQHVVPSIGIHTSNICPADTTLLFTGCDSVEVNGTMYYTSQTINNTVNNTLTGCARVYTSNITIYAPQDSTQTISGCDSIELNGTVYYTSQTVIDTYTNSTTGCDSTVTSILNVNSNNKTVSNVSITLTANEIGATYKWLNCLNNYAEVIGETAQTFTPTANGQYAVEITKNGCTDTSDCMLVNSVGINEAINLSFDIYPIPSKDFINITLNNMLNQQYDLVIYNSIGEIVINKKLTTKNTTIDVKNLASGIYVTKVFSNKATAVKLITIE